MPAGETLTGVYLDSGENGLFSPDEFEAITAELGDRVRESRRGKE